jgi:hypothetical protein
VLIRKTKENAKQKGKKGLRKKQQKQTKANTTQVITFY